MEKSDDDDDDDETALFVVTPMLQNTVAHKIGGVSTNEHNKSAPASPTNKQTTTEISCCVREAAE